MKSRHNVAVSFRYVPTLTQQFAEKEVVQSGRSARSARGTSAAARLRMLRFAVHDSDGPAKDWSLDGAHLVGRDDVAVPGTIRFKNGCIECEKRGSRAVGLALMHDAGSMGRLMLQTSLLPDREEPYILPLELARHRIKTFIAKSEEWQMFELSAEHPAMKLWEQARQLFTQAMTSIDPLKADRKGRQSLRSAIDATERLALAHADVLLHRRFGSRRASSSTLGVHIWPTRNSQGLRDLVKRDFDVVGLPLRWRDIEVEEGRYNWEPTDRWMQWAQKESLPIIAGPLLDFSKAAVPDWLYVWQHDYDTCRDMAYDHLERVVQRYGSAVNFWNIGTGLNINNDFRFTPDQMIDLVRMASLIVRHSRKGARMLLEVSQPFGEHTAFQETSLPPFAFLERVVQEGVRIDAVGVRIEFGKLDDGLTTRDLMQISNLLDRFFFLEKPVIVSGMSVPSDTHEKSAGWWHDNWSTEVQSQWARRVFALAMSRPYVETVFWSDLYDHEHMNVPSSGLIDETGRAKPALARLINMRKRLRKPLGPLNKKPSQPPASST